jgi:hypothetical protein
MLCIGVAAEYWLNAAGKCWNYIGERMSHSEVKIKGQDILHALDYDAGCHGPSGQIESLCYRIDHLNYLLKAVLDVMTGEQRLAVYKAMFGDTQHYCQSDKEFVA